MAGQAVPPGQGLLRRLTLAIFFLSLASTSSWADDWVCGRWLDEMTGRSTKYWVLRSDDQRPNGTLARLFLPFGDAATPMALRLDSGIIDCPAQGCRLRVKVDDAAPVTVRANSTEGNLDTIVIAIGKATSTRWRKATGLLIEAPVYRSGATVFHFTPTGERHCYP